MTFRAQELEAELAAQLAELNSISDALGTNEGHSSVDHILALRGQLAAANKRAEDAERDAAIGRCLVNDMFEAIENLKD